MTFRDKIAAAKAAQTSALPAAAKPPGLVLTGSVTPEPAGLAGTSMVQGRQLGYPDEGEHVPLKFESDGVDLRWSRLAHTFETDLCVVRHDDNPESAWLAIRAKGQDGPLLIHKLPLVILDHDEPPF